MHSNQTIATGSVQLDVPKEIISKQFVMAIRQVKHLTFQKYHLHALPEAKSVMRVLYLFMIAD